MSSWPSRHQSLLYVPSSLFGRSLTNGVGVGKGTWGLPLNQTLTQGLKEMLQCLDRSLFPPKVTLPSGVFPARLQNLHLRTIHGHNLSSISTVCQGDIIPSFGASREFPTQKEEAGETRDMVPCFQNGLVTLPTALGISLTSWYSLSFLCLWPTHALLNCPFTLSIPCSCSGARHSWPSTAACLALV